ncbi:hypothetical protein [Salinispora vitiensis]|uniref:hypothetical protein n=1 Tax=Salinispora vitiensis TaxID=999544 RepID=UPI00035F0E8A|nr:hypothetical protein [Salinispora vitiensis]
MTNSVRPTARVEFALDATFGLIALAGIAFTIKLLADSWGIGYAVFDTIVALILVGLALARRLNRSMTTAAGVTLALIAVIVSQIADLPQEPSPIASLALAVLIGSALRHVPDRWATGIGVGGLAVIIACWATGGFRAVAALATLAYVTAVVIGWSMREVDKGRRAAAERDRAAAADHTTWR